VRAATDGLYATNDWPEDRWPFGELVRLMPASRWNLPALSAARANPGRQCSASIVFRVATFFVQETVFTLHGLQRRSRFESVGGADCGSSMKHAALLALEGQVFKTVRRVIANSRMVAEEIVHWHDFPAERIHVVPNGIGASLPRISRPEARRRLEIPERAFCVLFVGTGWERKGLRFAVEAVESLGRDALLLVAGRGNANHYRSSRARFLGAVEDLPVLFSAADVFTLPTIYDPFSNACLEAIAAGLPVVTTTANGFSEILTPGVHGDVVEPGDVEALARALEAWKGRDTATTSEACRILAEDYSIERNVEATLDVIGLAPE
jgi:UDP-glucose:(heptosyl)LPS alpha-1,3-glucosyltransferase